ncbi:MAG: polyprenol monophosphomannose synthase [Actinomycetota bacterium]
MSAVVVLPTYNEAEMLAVTVAAIRDAAPEVRILIADDASPDGTGDIADDLAAGDARIQVHHRPGKQGLGRAYLDSFKLLLADESVHAILEMDADGSHDASDVPRLIAALGRCDLAIGSRYVPGGRTQGWSRAREALSRFGNRYARRALGLPVRDSTSGFRAYSRRALSALDLDSVTSDGYGFQIEMAWRTWLNGFEICEVPICFTERRAGSSKMSRAIVLEALVTVARWAAQRRRPEGPRPEA